MIRLAHVLAFLVGIGIFTAAPLSAQSPTGTVVVTVINSVTKRPIPAATVALDRMWSAPKETTTKDSQGRTFYQTIIPPGNPVLSEVTAATNDNGQARFTGVTPDHYAIVLRGFKSTANWDTFIVAEGEQVQRSVDAIPPSILQGTVTDEHGKPLNEAIIEVLDYQTVISNERKLYTVSQGRTDASGRYRVEVPDTGHYLVRATPGVARMSRPGLLTLYYPAARLSSGAQRVSMTAGQDAAPIDFRLPEAATYAIRGRITGEPTLVRQAYLMAEPITDTAEQTSPDRRLAANLNDGSFIVTQLFPGRYYLNAMAPGNAPFAGLVVDVTDHDVPDVQLAPFAQKELKGVVHVSPGLRQPSEVEFTVHGPLPGYSMGGRGKVDPATGEFTVKGLLPLNYIVNANGPGYLKSIRFAGHDVDPLNFSPNGEDALTIEIAAGHGILKGTVPLEGVDPKKAIVMVAPDGEQAHRADLIRTSRVTDRGTFEFKDLAPGSYQVFFWSAYDESLWMQIPEFRALFSGVPLKIEGAEAHTVALKPISSATIGEAKTRF